ncbi:MAG: Cell surface protein [Parcubacteria group bacterium GW2011_GWC1_45_14]|nr:MAG: Cell surface protein [Candidatus Moranbacteria bacterium GW2011_GWC2_45_10]KKT95199.1 MAG: Cell surface protein [Parcubacteria group bacterium GW2011_GWC1_45_14]
MREAVKKSTFFLSVASFLLFAAPVSFAQTAEEFPHMPGTFSGTGTRFEITDSEYLNIKLESAEEVAVRMESAPEMVVLEVESSGAAESSQMVLSGLSPKTTYHKYQDGYQNHEPFATDAEGSFSFVQDIGERHVIFIQPRKSTKFIKNDATGGDCGSIGSWDVASKTCALTQDVNESIQINSDNITLDGNGHSITGTGTGSGIYASYKKGIKIKNVTINSFYYGIYFSSSSSYNEVSFVNLKNNRNGVYFQYSGNNIVTDSAIIQSIDSGIKLNYAMRNILSNNTISGGNKYGVSQAWQNYNGSTTGNTYENNDISGNGEAGIYIYGGRGDILDNNKIDGNLSDGMRIVEGYYEKLHGNAMSGNKPYNFLMQGGGNIDTNDIDTSNKVEEKSIYFIKNIEGVTYDGLADAGIIYCVNCADVTFRNLTLSENNAQIRFLNTKGSLLENITSPDKNITIDFSGSDNNIIRKNTLERAYLSSSNNNLFYNNNFMGTSISIFQANFSNGISFNLDLPIGGNYWKKNEAKCVDSNNDKICDNPYGSGKIIDYYPWAQEFKHEDAVGSACQENCHSSVLFLPGHQASRLYREGVIGTEDQLWEPNRNQDVRQLFMDPESGESVDPGIYTRDAIDEAFGFADNVYKKFMLSMDEFVESGAIKEWRAFPYDWRMPLEEIVDEGTRLEDGSTANVLEQIREMAKSSKSGKVSLVGHSNGGLLAKVVIDRLEKSGEAGLVDRLIMVGTPQIGTPKAMAGLLHGDGINLLKGLLLDKETARGLGENMASAYNLLPSKKYFEIVQSPVIEFDYDVRDIYDFRSIYGESISGFGSFKSFLLGDNGERTEPEEDDTDSPNVLKNTFLSRSIETHNNLDSWRAPEHMEVIQIAGWGLDTVRGISYDDCDILFCPDNLSNLDRKLILTEDGDETVVVPSAAAMEGEERYYLNLKLYNNPLDLKFRISRNHADILEATPLQDFIKNIIQNKKEQVTYISTEKPKVEKEYKRLRYRLHSPVKIDIIDENGNHIGIIENNDQDSDIRRYEQEVPNSYYMEFGETKYAGAEGRIAQDVILKGEDLGTFTFEIDEVFGTGETKNTTFENIPVMEGMIAEIAISDSVGEMEIDINGDGEKDFIIRPGEEASKETSLEILEKMIGFLDIHQTVKDRLIDKIGNARKQLEKGHNIATNAMLANVKQQIETFSRENAPEKFRIPKEEAEKLIVIIERIQLID